MVKKVLFVALLLSLTILSGVAFATGVIYYGSGGSNYTGCGFSTPCKTLQYAIGRACAHSKSSGEPYAVYTTGGVYAGGCDKSGGNGYEPGEEEPGAMSDLGNVLWPTLSMFVVGLVLGAITLGRRR
jgi:hypothetical protein